MFKLFKILFCCYLLQFVICYRKYSFDTCEEVTKNVITIHGFMSDHIAVILHHGIRSCV